MTDESKGVDRPRGILSAADRRFLRGEKKYKHRQSLLKRRATIRERVVNGILDFEVLLTELSENDREKIVDELGIRAPEHSLIGGSYAAPSGVTDAIGFLYLLHTDREDFLTTVDHAVKSALRHRGEAVTDVTTRMDIERADHIDTEAAIVRALQATGDAPADRLREIPPGNRWLTGDAVARRRREGDE
ncbi:hypothetical protein BRC68_10265 [Halobacteriales archaeon QH_6_64_20]|nr:MAG: hypothetical protein BRC68_10265 [Halobacteriales archaeon QH_6_64_20]